MIIATPASSRTVSSIPTAASGSDVGQPRAGPAVSLSANTANSSSRLSSSRTLLRCQNSRRNRQIQASRRPIDQDRQHDEADEPGDVEAALVEAEVVDGLERDVVHAVADPDDRLARSQLLMTGWTSSAARARAWLVRSAENDELATTSGRDQRGGERPLVGVEVAGHAARRSTSLIEATSVSRSSARSTVSSTRAASVRTAVQRSEVSPRSVVRVVRREARERVLEDRRAVGGRDARGERRVDGATLLSNARSCCAAIAAPLGREVVLGLDRGARGVARCCGEDVARVLGGARRRRGRARGLPASSRGCAGRKSMPEDDRQRHDEERGRRDQPSGVAPGELRRGLGGCGEHGVDLRIGGSVPRIVRGHVDTGQRLGDEPGRDLAVGPAAGPRGEPAHDLAQVAGGGRAGRGDALVDEGLELARRTGPRAGTRGGSRSPPLPSPRGPRGRPS